MRSFVFAALAATTFAIPSSYSAGNSGTIHSSNSVHGSGVNPNYRPRQATSSGTNSKMATQHAHQSGGDRYLVIFNSSHPEYPQVSDVLSKLDLSEDHEDVQYTYDNHAFRGFSAHMGSHCLDALANMTNVAIVAPDVEVSAYGTQRGGAPWGLQRVSSGNTVRGDPMELLYEYSFDGDNPGAGVDIYVVDTGIRTDHNVFAGRARMGYSFQADISDQAGHGTHVSGTAGGDTVGVATGANIIGVKTLGANGSGSSTDTVKGMDWVVKQHNARKTQPGFVATVMSMSWGLVKVNAPIDAIIRSATQAGIHVSVAAGNEGSDACERSPGSSGGASGPAISVGSVGMGNTISSFSNTGSCVDIYAPGETVLSAFNNDTVSLVPLSGTSMATPHVTGIIAYWAAKRPDLAQDPAGMKTFLTSTALKSVVSGNSMTGDQLLLANNGQTGPLKKRALGLYRRRNDLRDETNLVVRDGEAMLAY